MKTICTCYDISRAELLKHLRDEIVSIWAGQTSHDRRRKTCNNWPLIITIYICTLFFVVVLECFDTPLGTPLLMSKQHILVPGGLSCTHRWRSKVILPPSTLLEVPCSSFQPWIRKLHHSVLNGANACTVFGESFTAFFEFHQRDFTVTSIPMMSFLHPPPQWFLWQTFCIVPPSKNNPLMQLKVLFQLQFLSLPEAMRAYYEQVVVAKALDFALLFVCIYNLPMWQSHLVSATGNLCLYLKYLQQLHVGNNHRGREKSIQRQKGT